jgi:acyl CoA:acetate/3-ketoacid CoA transferase alpha subunit
LRADFALVHAFLADYLGNLSYALTAPAPVVDYLVTNE